MTPTRFLKSFVVCFILFLLLDGFWHGQFLANFYESRLVAINPALAGGMAFNPFIIFVNAINAVTLSYFVLQAKSMRDAVWVGILLGFTVVGTVNFLNHAFMPQRWDIVLALVDTGWGVVAGIVGALAVTSVAGAPKKRGLRGLMKRFVG